jgi:transposase InsO family protein
MKYNFMKEYFKKFDIEKMAKVLKVSRSGYYDFVKRSESARNKENRRLTDKIIEIHKASRNTYGSPRIKKELKSQGESSSRKRVARLMRKANICAKMVKRRKKISYPPVKNSSLVVPNHLQQQFTVDYPNKVWVSDITYIPTKEGWLYLCAFMDIYSRKIVGLSMSKRIDTTLVSRALQQAVIHRNPPKGLIHHSDKGSQYTSTAFKEQTSSYGITLSMSGKGCCYDNAVAESFFHTLKTEHVNFCDFRTREEGVNSLFEYIEVFYNRERRHSTLGYLSPVEFETINEKKLECVLSV